MLWASDSTYLALIFSECPKYARESSLETQELQAICPDLEKVPTTATLARLAVNGLSACAQLEDQDFGHGIFKKLGKAPRYKLKPTHLEYQYKETGRGQDIVRVLFSILLAQEFVMKGPLKYISNKRSAELLEIRGSIMLLTVISDR